MSWAHVFAWKSDWLPGGKTQYPTAVQECLYFFFHSTQKILENFRKR